MFYNAHLCNLGLLLVIKSGSGMHACMMHAGPAPLTLVRYTVIPNCPKGLHRDSGTVLANSAPICISLTLCSQGRHLGRKGPCPPKEIKK